MDACFSFLTKTVLNRFTLKNRITIILNSLNYCHFKIMVEFIYIGHLHSFHEVRENTYWPLNVNPSEL